MGCAQAFPHAFLKTKRISRVECCPSPGAPCAAVRSPFILNRQYLDAWTPTPPDPRTHISNNLSESIWGGQIGRSVPACFRRDARQHLGCWHCANVGQHLHVPCRRRSVELFPALGGEKWPEVPASGPFRDSAREFFFTSDQIPADLPLTCTSHLTSHLPTVCGLRSFSHLCL